MKKFITAIALLLVSHAFAATLSPVQLLNPAGSTSGQAIVSTGPSSAPAWGSVAATALAAQAANTVVANITASSASPTAVAIPTCNTSTSALQYTPVTGWTCYTNSAATTATLAQFAATTSAQLAGVLSDETGTGAAVFGTSPTIGTAVLNTPTISGGTINNATVGQATPLAGSFTTLSATGLITPASSIGIKGTATNDSPSAGNVGEFITNSATGVAQSSATLTNITSISLTAGDWDVSCSYAMTAASGTTTSSLNFGLTTTSLAQAPTGQRVILPVAWPATTGGELACPTVRFLLSATTTIYLTAAPTFAVSTATSAGVIWARRRR